MKKVISILFALLILLSGLQLTVATHFCGGEIAQVRVSLSGENGTCGMEDEIEHKAKSLGFSTHCCDDESSVFAVDETYSQVNYQLKSLVEHSGNAPFVLFSESFSFSHPVSSALVSVRPPGYNLIHNVSLPFICVFRI